MNINLQTDDNIYEWLTRFTTKLELTARRGKYVSGREISELLVSLDQFNEDAQGCGFLQQHLTSLKIARDLLDAAHRLAERNVDNDIPANAETSTQLFPSRSTQVDRDFESAAYSKPKVNEFDSFETSRRQAIESTIVHNTGSLPKFSDIIGIEDAKSTLFEALVDPVQYPDWFSNSDLKPWKTLLLYGPPGTGKSILSQAIVREINSLLYQVSSSDLISTWSGQSERLIRELFDHAIAQEETAVIFIDEVDSLCRTRSSSEDDANRRVKTELLVQIQRIHTTSNVVLICATNCPWDLDPAFLRRFEKKIYIGLPDFHARIAMLKGRLQNTTVDSCVTMEYIAEATEGFSGDDIRRFATELAYAQFRYYKIQELMSVLLKDVKICVSCCQYMRGILVRIAV
ncbi:ATPase, AAA family [Dictyocaulus viviparus]|uniref:ATPase, AAA family n=1 Tax=Dictyocaulus viviparus TaxID=29172 RepID=A0A0D8XC96_DICVI|nr:ATPase, AAA family [Dictyocaulus viviparus]